jgi:NAD(P)-dependent dehydrogenase (short-subunit alcohol dehydrogenase family)
MALRILITGASSGIGKITAEYLADKGHIVYGTSRNPEKQQHQKIKFLSLDLTDEKSIMNVVDAYYQHEDRLDVLVNNAGIGISGSAEESASHQFKKVFQTNYFGVCELINAFLPHLRKQDQAKIINISSIAGYMGLPFRAHYSAAKSALIRLTESYRLELKPFDVQICHLAPGDFATNIAGGREKVDLNENSPYFKNYKRSLKLMDADVEKGEDPILVAKHIERIIHQKKLSASYPVGSFLQKFAIKLKHILPALWFEAMLANHYKL